MLNVALTLAGAIEHHQRYGNIPAIELWKLKVVPSRLQRGPILQGRSPLSLGQVSREA